MNVTYQLKLPAETAIEYRDRVERLRRTVELASVARYLTVPNLVRVIMRDGEKKTLSRSDESLIKAMVDVGVVGGRPRGS